MHRNLLCVIIWPLQKPSTNAHYLNLRLSPLHCTQADSQRESSEKRLLFTPQPLNKPSDTLSPRQTICFHVFLYTHTPARFYMVCAPMHEMSCSSDRKPRPSDVITAQQINGLQANEVILCLIVSLSHNKAFGTFHARPSLSPVTDDRSLKYPWVFAPTYTLLQ